MKYNLFNLTILLTRKCNQTCYYCNNFNIKSTYTEIDTDYLNWILNIYTKYIPDLHIELSGGEPGMISNIEDVFETLMKNIYVKKIKVLSNGMIRKIGYNLRERFQNKFEYNSYCEHFCLEIYDKNILFFYPELSFYNIQKDWIKFILVLSDITLDSLLNNFEFFQNIYHLPIIWKSITPKTEYPTEEHMKKLYSFYQKLLAYNPKAIVDFDRLEEYKKFKNKKLYKICSKISIYQFIDMEYKKIGLCSMQVEQSNKYDITQENIEKAIDGKLFHYNSFCQTCYKTNSHCVNDRIERRFFKRYNNIYIV